MKSETKQYLEALRRLKPCADAMQWAKSYDDPQRAWDQCERGDWMLWLCGKLSGDFEGASRKKLVLVACECARLALPYVKSGESRPLKAIETAERWARGEKGVTIEDVRSAADAAADAAAASYADADTDYVASAVAAASAADAAAAFSAFSAYASYAASASAAAAAYAVAAAYAAYVASYAASASAAAAASAYAADAAARKRTLRNCADIVRQYYPKCPLLHCSPIIK